MKDKEIVYWKMRNGELVSIDDMDINHLRNVLKMIVKNSQKHKQTKLLEPHIDKYGDLRYNKFEQQMAENGEFSITTLNGDMGNEFNNSQTCYFCGEIQDSLECCGFDATESDIY